MFAQIQRRIYLKLYERSFSTHPCAAAWVHRGIFSSIHVNDQSPTSLSSIVSTYNRKSLHTSTVSLKDESISAQIKQELQVFKTVDFSQLKSAPFPSVLYGFGGIIPFVLPPIYFILFSYSPFLATAQLMYGACILAFVGGVKWGNALGKDDVSNKQIGLSTIPSLVGWGSLLVPVPLGFLVVSSGLLGALYVDLASSTYPPWFCAMRTTLTTIAVSSLLSTFLCCILS